MMFCKKGCSNGIRAWSSATAVPSLKWLSSYLEATELHYVMYRLRQDRMDVIEINLIFLKLASDYDLSQSEFMSSRIQFPPHCDMLLSVGNYSVASNNESCHGPAADSIWWRPSCDHWIRCPHLAGIKRRRKKHKRLWVHRFSSSHQHETNFRTRCRCNGISFDINDPITDRLAVNVLVCSPSDVGNVSSYGSKTTAAGKD